jgi:hypothetical protein
MHDRSAQQLKRIFLFAAIRPNFDGRLSTVRDDDRFPQHLHLSEQFACPRLENGLRYSLFHCDLHPNIRAAIFLNRAEPVAVRGQIFVINLVKLREVLSRFLRQTLPGNASTLPLTLIDVNWVMEALPCGVYLVSETRPKEQIEGAKCRRKNRKVFARFADGKLVKKWCGHIYL